ncbi:MAG: hypothetical protein WKG00_05215 [Polyangiaceae bacterium]
MNASSLAHHHGPQATNSRAIPSHPASARRLARQEVSERRNRVHAPVAADVVGSGGVVDAAGAVEGACQLVHFPAALANEAAPAPAAAPSGSQVRSVAGSVAHLDVPGRRDVGHHVCERHRVMDGGQIVWLGEQDAELPVALDL